MLCHRTKRIWLEVSHACNSHIMCTPLCLAVITKLAHMLLQSFVKPQYGTEVEGSPNNEKISALVDIVNGGYTPFDLHYAPFCSGQSHLPNGDIVVCGGGGVTYKFPGFQKGYNVSAGCRSRAYWQLSLALLLKCHPCSNASFLLKSCTCLQLLDYPAPLGIPHCCRVLPQ
jgi:hypothetical protein